MPLKKRAMGKGQGVNTDMVPFVNTGKYTTFIPHIMYRASK